MVGHSEVPEKQGRHLLRGENCQRWDADSTVQLEAIGTCIGRGVFDRPDTSANSNLSLSIKTEYAKLFLPQQNNSNQVNRICI